MIEIDIFRSEHLPFPVKKISVKTILSKLSSPQQSAVECKTMHHTYILILHWLTSYPLLTDLDLAIHEFCSTHVNII